MRKYKETYAPVMYFPLVRVFLYVLISMELFVDQIDIKTAFLNWSLEEYISVFSTYGIPAKKYRQKYHSMALNKHIRRGIGGSAQVFKIWNSRSSQALLV